MLKRNRPALWRLIFTLRAIAIGRAVEADGHVAFCAALAEARWIGERIVASIPVVSPPLRRESARQRWGLQHIENEAWYVGYDDAGEMAPLAYPTRGGALARIDRMDGDGCEHWTPALMPEDVYAELAQAARKGTMG